MTSYIAINNTEVDPDSPITAELMTKMRDNPIAISEGATGSPINQTEWHLYNQTTVGGASTGVIYDFAVNGAVASIISPDFADGYEYRFWFDGASTSAAGAYLVSFYRETSAAYSPTRTLFTPSTTGWDSFIDLTIDSPRVARFTHLYSGNYYEYISLASTNTASVLFGGVHQSTTSQKLLRCQFSMSTGNFDAGKMYMFRRRVMQ